MMTGHCVPIVPPIVNNAEEIVNLGGFFVVEATKPRDGITAALSAAKNNAPNNHKEIFVSLGDIKMLKSIL